MCTGKPANNAETTCVYQIEFCKHEEEGYDGITFVHMNKIFGDVELFKELVEEFIKKFGMASKFDPGNDDVEDVDEGQ